MCNQEYCRKCHNWVAGKCLADWYTAGLDSDYIDFYDLTENGYLDECIKGTVDEAGFEEIESKIDSVLSNYRIGKERREEIRDDLVELVGERIKSKLIELMNDNIEQLLLNHQADPKINIEIIDDTDFCCKEYK